MQKSPLCIASQTRQNRSAGRRIWFGVALFLCLTGFAAQASAAGLFLPGRGVKPLGRAGAFVASSQGDLNSLWYNPAGLAGLEGTKLTIDLALIDLSFQFQRAPRTRDNGDKITYDPVQNEAAPQPDPQILIGGNFPVFGTDKLKWGFGIYAPYLSPHTFPEDGAQRYSLVDNNGSVLLYANFALAYEVTKNLRVGVGFQNMFASFQQITVTSGYAGAFGDPEDEDLDILSKINITSLFNPTGNFGAWVRIAPILEGAISVQLPVTVKDDAATIEVRMPSHVAFDDAYLDGNTLQAKLAFPLIARLGLRLNLEKFDYELAFVYETWSFFDEIQATPNDISVQNVRGVGSIRVAPLSIPMKYQDTFSIRNGFEVNILPSLDVRTGYMYEKGAIPDEYYSPFLAEGDKHVMTLGATFKRPSWSIDASFAYYYIGDRTISNSEVRQINPTDVEGEYTLVVGNGDYAQRYLIVGTGFNLTF